MIYDEIGNVRKSLTEEADRAMESLCGPMGLASQTDEDPEFAGGFSALRPISAASVPLRTSAAVSAGASAAVAQVPERILLTAAESEPLLEHSIFWKCDHSWKILIVAACALGMPTGLVVRLPA